MRVLIVDDQPEFLEALAGVLEAMADVEVVGRASNGRDALELAAALKPDLVITDYSMPHMDGFALTRELKSRPHPPKVVVMSLYGEPEYWARALYLGADAYLKKSESASALAVILAGLMKASGAGDKP